MPLLKFYFHEEVRKAAVSGIVFHLKLVADVFSWPVYRFDLFFSQAMPELLRSAKLAIENGQAAGRDESYLKQLADFIIPALVEALHKVFMVLYFFLLMWDWVAICSFFRSN